MLQYNFPQIAFMFMLFCNYGWVQESIIESVYRKKIINRGFLKGPYIPIYGFGGLTILLCCLPFKENGFMVYMAGMLSCTVLEYFVGWVMETIFHKQFWDYSMMKFTYKNRISLISSLFWGLLSLFMIYFLHDIVNAVVTALPMKFICIYDIAAYTVMLIDAGISISRHIQFKNYIRKFPYEKARQVIQSRFIRLGGSVLRRRRNMLRFVNRIKFELGNGTEDDLFNDFPVMEDEYAEREEVTVKK